MEQLIEILEGLHPEIDYSTCDDLMDNHILDSFDIASIVSEINETFEVSISQEDITPDNFNSAASLYELIERLLDEI